MDNRSDRELVDSCRRSDQETYASLVRRYSRRVFAICYGKVGRPDDAEDLAQETFARAFSRIHTLQDGGQFYPWLAKIARNLCTDFLRRKRPTEVELDECHQVAHPQSGVNPEYVELQKAIEKLPEPLRTPLVGYYIGGQSTDEIAEAIGTAPATVHTRLSRARRELRRLLMSEEVPK